MPSKKRYNSRFPPARIKKIMQTDEEIGKVAAPVPVIISRFLERFLEQILVKTSDVVTSRNAKTLSTSHIKYAVMNENKFDFLKDLVADIEDIAEETPSPDNGNTKKRRKRKQKNPKIVVHDEEENFDDTDSADEEMDEEDVENDDDSPYHGRRDMMLPIAVNVEDNVNIKDNDSVASLPVPIATPMASPNTMSAVMAESLQVASHGVEVDDDYDS